MHYLNCYKIYNCFDETVFLYIIKLILFVSDTKILIGTPDITSVVTNHFFRLKIWNDLIAESLNVSAGAISFESTNWRDFYDVSNIKSLARGVFGVSCRSLIITWIQTETYWNPPHLLQCEQYLVLLTRSFYFSTTENNTRCLHDYVKRVIYWQQQLNI